MQETTQQRARIRRHRLWWLLAVRVAACVAVAGLVRTLEPFSGSPTGWLQDGFHIALFTGLVLTAIYAAVFPRVRQLEGFAALQVATDVILVAALVHTSGAGDSLFGFLFLPVAVYAAMFFDRRGAYGSAAAASLAYGLVLLASRWAPGPAADLSAEDPRNPALLALWAVHTGALVLVALLSSALSRELRRADHALDRSANDLDCLRRLHERTVESLTSGLLTTDPEGRITSFNPEAFRITGLQGAQVVGRGIDEVLPGARKLLLLAAKSEAGEGGESGPRPRRRARMSYCSQSGEPLHLGLAGSLLRDEEGVATGYVLIFQDVTQVVEMETQLRWSERLAAAGQLAAGMAHEVRNPLAAISGSIQMLQSGLGDSDQDREHRRLMEIAVREADRLDSLIRDFLQFARPTPPKREPVAVEEVVREILQVFEATRPEGVTLRSEIEPGLSLVADAGQLKQLLWNLLLNAVQAMPGGGKIRIAGGQAPSPPQEVDNGRRNGAEESPSAWGEIAVSDTGMGIPPQVMDRIFDPFFTTKQEGSGLGLATVHRITKDNGGVLRVESDERRGATFRILLPIAGETA